MNKKAIKLILFALLMFCLLQKPISIAFADDVPKGFLDPVKDLDLTLESLTSDLDQFWRRLEEIYLVPVAANIAGFTEHYKDYAKTDDLFHPISGEPLILKRGQILPEYRLDISYPDIIGKPSGRSMFYHKMNGEYIMTNIQFGTTTPGFQGILHNGGGSYAAYSWFGVEADGLEEEPTIYNFSKSIEYGSQNRLPEASHAISGSLKEENPGELYFTSSIYRVYVDRDSGKVKDNRAGSIQFRVLGVKLNDKPIVSVDAENQGGIFNTKADKDAGETALPIPEALAIAILGSLAALAGAGAGGGNGGDDEPQKKQSKYKMYLRKDFGDAIRFDKPPVTIYARIVEVTPEGEEKDRPDLTQGLEIFSDGVLKVESAAMTENYLGALVSATSVKGKENPGEGVVSIKFSGEGSFFQNNVSFRLIGDAYISFPEQGNYLNMTLPMLLGDGETYETSFILHDFMSKPEVKLDLVEAAPIEAAIEEIKENQYLLKITNKSSKPEGFSAKKQFSSMGIIAENEEEQAENSINIELYPEGLSIREIDFDEEGNALISAFTDEEAKDTDDISPTKFVLEFALRDPGSTEKIKVKVMEPGEFKPIFADLMGKDESTVRLADRFKYHIEELGGNLKEYSFIPKEAVVEKPGQPYYLTLPISSAYLEEEYKLDLPIRLLGGGPGPMEGWDEEFAKMKKIVKNVGGISPELAKIIRENGKKMSTTELRLINKKICQDAITYYTKDAAEYNKIADEMDTMLTYAEWIKWFGDIAFSYLIKTYYGDTAEAILSPAKDLFASLLGEIIWALSNGEPFDYETLEFGEGVSDAFENLINNFFDGKLEGISGIKQGAYVIAGFLVWRMAKNIYDNIDENGQADLYTAITATASDLTVKAMQEVVGDYFKKAVKSKKMQDALGSPMGRWLQDLLPDTTLVNWYKDNAGKDAFKTFDFSKAEIIEEYLKELFGEVMAKATEVNAEAAKDAFEASSGRSGSSIVDVSNWPEISWDTVFTNEHGHDQLYKITFRLYPGMIDTLFTYIFNKLFEYVPFGAGIIDTPADPPLVREN